MREPFVLNGSRIVSPKGNSSASWTILPPRLYGASSAVNTNLLPKRLTFAARFAKNTSRKISPEAFFTQDRQLGVRHRTRIPKFLTLCLKRRLEIFWREPASAVDTHHNSRKPSP
jgi:hypothetical protein